MRQMNQIIWSFIDASHLCPFCGSLQPKLFCIPAGEDQCPPRPPTWNTHTHFQYTHTMRKTKVNSVLLSQIGRERTFFHEFSRCSHVLVHHRSSRNRINPSKHPSISMTTQNNVPVCTHTDKQYNIQPCRLTHLQILHIKWKHMILGVFNMYCWWLYCYVTCHQCIMSFTFKQKRSCLNQSYLLLCTWVKWLLR